MDYSSMTLAELREVARSRQLKSVTGMRKAELVQTLEELDREEQTPKKKGRPGGKAEAKTEGRTEIRTEGRTEERSERKAEGRPETKQESMVTEPRTYRRQTERRSQDNRNAGRIVQRFDNRNSYTENWNTRSENRSERPVRTETVVAHSSDIVEGQQTIENETQPHTERMQEEKRPLNIRAEAFTYEEFMKLESPELLELDSGNEVNGILEIVESYGFIRSANYLPGDEDVYVSAAQIRRFNLKTGDILRGNKKVKIPTEKFRALLYLTSVNGYDPLVAQKRRPFEELTPIFPNEKIKPEQPGAGIPMRIVDVIAPIGKGQRGMIVSPPKAGKTTLLKQMAKTISTSYPDMHMLVLLIDERPEEVTDIRESIEGPNVEVIYSTFDELPEHHKRVAEMVLERAKRLVEHKKDVVILLDSITRLARAYNLIVPPSGRTLTGGLDPAALHMPKKFFGAARNIREGGSLTILATALVETGSKMDDVVFEEFKGTGNMELVLDRKLSEKRIFPALDISKSGTRRDDLLLTKEEQDAMYLIHREIGGAKGEEAIEEVLRLFVRTKNNEEFLQLVQRSLGRR
ncbi:MAG: transcription termination factor Rho [Clostridium sp.]|nr:transcription termination factor Rho [Clostridium sp.]